MTSDSSDRSSKALAQAGFSLTEMLVALFILSIIAGSATALMARSVSLQKSFEADAGRDGQFQRAHALMRDDLATMTRKLVRPVDVRVPEHILLGGSGRSDGPFLSLARSSVVPSEQANNTGRESAVVYVRDGERIIRNLWLTTTPETSAPDLSRVVMEGVIDLNVEYGADNGEWLTEWVAGLPDADLPERLKVSISFRDGRNYELSFLTGAAS